MASCINFLSLNVRGLHDRNKRNKTLHFLKKSNASIILLQETFCTNELQPIIDAEWTDYVIYHNCTNSPHSRGVSVLFKKTLNVEVLDTYKSPDARLLLMNIKINDSIFTVANMYAPNTINGRVDFFTQHTKRIKQFASFNSNIFVSGDMNIFLTQNDKSSRVIDADLSRKRLLTMMDYLDVNDELKNFGYTCISKGNNSKSRIDYILYSKNPVFQTVKKEKLHFPFSDHKALILKINIEKKKRGPGYWKFNETLLDDSDYIKLIKSLLLNTPELDKFESKQMKWEYLKIRIKEKSIQYSIIKARTKKYAINHLNDELATLEEKESLNELQKQRQQEILLTLEKRLTQEANGAKLRSKEIIVEHSDKNSKYFLSLEKSRQENNNINSLKTKNGTVTMDENIIEEQVRFYTDLYSSKAQPTNKVKEYINAINFPNKLSNQDNELISNEISFEECDTVVSKMKKNISPGSDGLTSNFYKEFWPDIKKYVVESINESYNIRTLPPSFRKIIMTLLYKKNERDLLKNYRPISLSNTDYKILAFVLANRLQLVISKLISPHQTAYINGRYIGNSCRLLLDIFEYFEDNKNNNNDNNNNNNNNNGAILCLDFTKAFDSIEWNFMFETLRKFNFSENFIKWIKLLYTKPFINIKQNGWLTQSINLERSCRQGCPVSAMIFILCCEVMSLKLTQSDNIKGITIDDTEYKISQSADDTALFLKDKDSINESLKIIKQFSKYSGLHLNIEKTEGVWLGASKNFEKTYKGIKFTDEPIRYLGIYFGHNKDKCYELNWLEKINKLEKTLDSWKKRKLTLFGKITVIKSLAISKLIYSASILPYNSDLIKTIDTILYKFLWDGKDKIRRNIIINSINKGGLNMIDFQSQLDALKAAWIPRLYNQRENFNKIPYLYFKQIIPDLDILLKMNSYVGKDFENIPLFYKQVLNAHARINDIIDWNIIKQHEIAQQVIWCNHLFKINGTPLYFKSWIRSGIIYVKDLFIRQDFLNINHIYEKLMNKTNWISEFYQVSSALNKTKQFLDLQKLNFINIPNKVKFRIKNVLIQINKQRSSFFYPILRDKKAEKWYLKKKWEREFCYIGNKQVHEIIWNDFFNSKIRCMEKKVANFSFKIINNILPGLTDLFVFGKVDSYLCSVCGHICNLKHILYDCTLAQDMWKYFYNISGLKVNYRKIVIGYTGVDEHTHFLNYLISITAYGLYKTYLKELNEKVPRSFQTNILQFKYEVECRGNIFFKNKWNILKL